MVPRAFDPDAAAARGAGLFGLPFTPRESRVVVVPVPFEATTSYGGGTSRAPAAILRESGQIDLFDLETGRPYEDGIAMLPIPRAVAAWDRQARRDASGVIRAGGEVAGRPHLVRALGRVNAAGARVNAWVRREAERALDAGKIPVVLGGDHSVPFGAIEAYAARYPGMGILHLDAHADLRDAYEGFTWSHASIFHNVMTRIPGVAKLVQVGVRDLGGREHAFVKRARGRIVLVSDPEIFRRKGRGESWDAIARRIVAPLPKRVYVSFDVDGLDPALCPHTGTPVPGGLSFQEATGLLAALVRSGRTIVGCDLCEVVPGPRGDRWDANVGARLLYKMIGFTLLSRRGL